MSLKSNRCDEVQWRYCKNDYISGLSIDIKFICNTFIWDLIVEFYRAIEKKFSLVAIPSIGSLQPCF
jgi:hypothetical protein